MTHSSKNFSFKTLDSQSFKENYQLQLTF